MIILFPMKICFSYFSRYVKKVTLMQFLNIYTICLNSFNLRINIHHCNTAVSVVFVTVEFKNLYYGTFKVFSFFLVKTSFWQLCWVFTFCHLPASSFVTCDGILLLFSIKPTVLLKYLYFCMNMFPVFIVFNVVSFFASVLIYLLNNLLFILVFIFF